MEYLIPAFAGGFCGALLSALLQRRQSRRPAPVPLAREPIEEQWARLWRYDGAVVPQGGEEDEDAGAKANDA